MPRFFRVIKKTKDLNKKDLCENISKNVLFKSIVVNPIILSELFCEGSFKGVFLW